MNLGISGSIGIALGNLYTGSTGLVGALVVTNLWT